MSDPYRPLDLGGRRRPRPPRVPDRRTLLSVYVVMRLAQLRKEEEQTPTGNPADLVRAGQLRARAEELRMLCRGVGLDGDTGRWLPLR